MRNKDAFNLNVLKERRKEKGKNRHVGARRNSYDFLCKREGEKENVRCILFRFSFDLIICQENSHCVLQRNSNYTLIWEKIICFLELRDVSGQRCSPCILRSSTSVQHRCLHELLQILE